MRALFLVGVLAFVVGSTALASSESAADVQAATAAENCGGRAKRDRCGGRERSVLKRERCGGMKIFDGSGVFNRRGCGG